MSQPSRSSDPSRPGDPDRADSDLARRKRERRHFEEVALAEGQLYWADRTEAGKRRQVLRGQRLREAAALFPGARVLDIGCGTGAYTAPLSQGSDALFVGIDCAPALLRLANERTGEHVSFSAADASNLPFATDTFDAVVGNAVLHHLPLDRALPELLRVLKPSGRFCFAEPNQLNPQVFAERSTTAMRKRFQVSDDEVAFIRWPLRKMLERAGFAEVDVIPFDFLYPAIPAAMIAIAESFGSFLERVPAVKEIAGSLLVRATKA
jgi:SAM-dependent methyltransferase